MLLSLQVTRGQLNVGLGGSLGLAGGLFGCFRWIDDVEQDAKMGSKPFNAVVI